MLLKTSDMLYLMKVSSTMSALISDTMLVLLLLQVLFGLSKEGILFGLRSNSATTTALVWNKHHLEVTKMYFLTVVIKDCN